MGLEIVGIGAVVYGGDVIQIPVTFKNIGPARISDSQWSCVIWKKGFFDQPQEGPWARTGPIEKDATMIIAPRREVPGDWGGGEEISVALDMELFDSKGDIVASVKPIRTWDVFYEIPKPAADWVEIISAEPMVA